MHKLKFTKAVAHGNDFVVLERKELNRCGVDEEQFPAFVRSICNRLSGVGADGVEVVSESGSADAEIHLWNSDGSAAELSGNGTRCVAAYLVNANRSVDGKCRIETASGTFELELTNQTPPLYSFKMRMKSPVYKTKETAIEKLQLSQGVELEVVVVDVGNPQCVVFVDSFDIDWQSQGREIENHPRFDNGTNVSFVRVIDNNLIEARFWERGAGATVSSGTGSVGAATAAIITMRCSSPVAIQTSAGNMIVEWSAQLHLSGNAQIVAEGAYLV